jgi:SAM-dependent methyltransferase
MAVEDFDYDSDPDRFRSNVETVERYGLVGDVHTEVAQRIAAEGLWPALDMGCGEGRFREAMGDAGPMIATDLSMTMLQKAPSPRICSDMTRLPHENDRFGSAVALWCLYHLIRSVDAIREAYRVLRPGGLFVTCAPSIQNDPELAYLFDEPVPSSFDSEFAPDLVAEVFGEVEIDRWDMPAVTLPDAEAVTLYLRGRRMRAEEAADVAMSVKVPLTLTKRGVLVWAYKEEGKTA